METGDFDDSVEREVEKEEILPFGFWLFFVFRVFFLLIVPFVPPFVFELIVQVHDRVFPKIQRPQIGKLFHLKLANNRTKSRRY